MSKLDGLLSDVDMLDSLEWDDTPAFKDEIWRIWPDIRDTLRSQSDYPLLMAIAEAAENVIGSGMFTGSVGNPIADLAAAISNWREHSTK